MLGLCGIHFIDVQNKLLINTPLQVLTAAPALHSLIIRVRNDAADILEFLFHIRGYVRGLILEYCNLGKDSTCLLAYIVALYPFLEILSLRGCYPLSSAAYCLIPRLKKLSELDLANCKVNYIYVNLSYTHVCICEHIEGTTPRNIFYIFRHQGNLLHF